MHFIFASHGPISSAFIESAKLITGQPLTNCHSISIDMDTSREDVFNQLNEMVETIPSDDPILVFTDLFGGSINRFMVEYASIRKMHIISGMNFPMILEAILSADPTTLNKQVPSFIQVGQSGIMDVLAEVEKGREKDEL